MPRLQLVQDPVADALLDDNPFALLVGMLLDQAVDDTLITMKAQPLRALVGARVSVVQGPQKVSHIAQQETGAKWVAERGHEVVGTIRDLGGPSAVVLMRAGIR